MSCVLRVWGADLEIDALLEKVRLHPITNWRRGDQRSKFSSHILESSGANFEVSDADMKDYNQQITDAIAFLADNKDDLRTMVSWSGVEEAVIDFGFNLKDTICPTDRLPAKLVSLAGEAGVAICVSHYPTDLGKWRYVEDEDRRDGARRGDSGIQAFASACENSRRLRSFEAR